MCMVDAQSKAEAINQTTLIQRSMAVENPHNSVTQAGSTACGYLQM